MKEESARIENEGGTSHYLHTVNYQAIFPTKRIPLRFRIYENGALIKRGEIPPDQAKAN